MFMAKVVGSIVSTQKEKALEGRKLLVLRPMLVDESDPAAFRPGVNTIVAVDSLGAGVGELVMFVQGSSARQAEGLRTLPIDAAVVGILDSVDILGNKIYNARDQKS